MNKRFLLAFIFCSSLLIVIISCSKINQSTDIGGSIIPAIDGVNTFDTTITVEAYNELFNSINDSIYVNLQEDHILGTITNDPFFGRTASKIFLELKPLFYPWTFSGVTNKDSLTLDSVVLVLGWKESYGDTSMMQRIRVYEMDLSNQFKIDSGYQIRQQHFTYSSLLGSKDVTPARLKDSVFSFRDTTVGQLRIRLNNTFGNRLLKTYDTTNAYRSDSSFKSRIRGFAIDSDPSIGNALMSFVLYNNPNTKLAIYYRANKDSKIDTTVSYFNFSDLSAHHNFIDRNFNGTPLLTSQGGTLPDNLVYLINAPGSYAKLKIPDLRNLGNRIVHRAELIMEQVYDVSDKTFNVPNALYLDTYDTSLSKYKTTPFDFQPDNTGLGQEQYGMYGKNGGDRFGNIIRTWKFNLTRYVQNVLTKKEPLHDLRVVAHRVITDQIRTNIQLNSGQFGVLTIPVNAAYAIGRVRLGGGNHATQKMRLRIVYSKI